MDLFQALVLGIVQGITEWLPVSSTGHLVIFQKLLGVSSSENLVFDLVVHLGTLLAVIAYFRNELGRIVMSVLAYRSRKSPEDALRRMLALMLIIGTIPAALAGVAFKDQIEQAFDIRLVGFALIVNALILFIAYAKGSSGQRKSARFIDAIVIGVFQAISILPGISRSGSTIGAGMLRGLERETAAVFAFLLSVPTLIGAFGFGIVTLDKFDATFATAAVGFVVAFAVGMVSIRYLLKAVKSGKLWVFSAYCLVVGALVVLLTSL